MFNLRMLGGASLEGPDGPVAGRAGLRQRVALLALLAVEHPRPLSRDNLLACLWPESGTDDGRHLLRDTLYILRSALGDDSVLSTGDDLRLNPDRLTCDLWEFEAALARDDPAAAVAVYHGPLLSGFHLSDAEEFEPLGGGERSRLARRYVQALEQLAEREMRGGDPVRAAEWWARLAGEDPYNSRIALRYMQALEAAGDRAGALRHASAHSDLLRTRPRRRARSVRWWPWRSGSGSSRAAAASDVLPVQSDISAVFPPRSRCLDAALLRPSGRSDATADTPHWAVLTARRGLVVGARSDAAGALSHARPPALAAPARGRGPVREPHRATGPR